MQIRVRRDQAEALRHIDAPCPTCGYNLRGLVQLSGTVCPECARTWTLGELLPLHDVTRRRSLWWMILLAIAPALLEIALFALGQTIDFDAPLRTAGIVAMVLVAFFGLFWIVLVAWSIAEDRDKPTAGYPAPAAVFLAVILLSANAILVAAGVAAVMAIAER